MSRVIAKSVGRPRSFDEAEVLARCMDVFWSKGYESTSMADLMKTTGLHKGSLYQAFGDKHALFLKALTGYISRMREALTSVVAAAPSALEGLRQATYHHIELGESAEGPHHGCMALNTLVEDAQRDPSIMTVLEAAYAFRMKMISDTVAQAQADGDLRSDWPAERIANLIAATEAGVLVELKGPLEVAEAKAVVDDVLASLKPPG